MPEPAARVVVVEDNPAVRVGIRDSLRDEGYAVKACGNGTDGLEQATRWLPDIVITDIRLPGMGGLELLSALREQGADCDVLVMTAYGSVETAVEALKLGAHDYLTKPFPMEKLLHSVAHLLRTRHLSLRHDALRQRVAELDGMGQLVGASAVMRHVYEMIRTVAPTDATVLICGASGTGKELVASTLQANSRRAEGPFVKVNAASLPTTLIEAELFGHERGAFTGASRLVKGRFEMAHRGTILLDEIDELPMEAQVKLLRVIQEREIERVGGRGPIPVDVRILAACKTDLAELVEAGVFRADLYYRLNVFRLDLPPLRERSEDVPLLAEHCLRAANRRLQRSIKGFSLEALEALCAYDFPGNVRELAHAVESAAILCGGERIERSHLPVTVREARPRAEVSPSAQACGIPAELPLQEALRRFEHQYLTAALAGMTGTRAELAQRLGISRKNLWEKLKQHDIS